MLFSAAFAPARSAAIAVKHRDGSQWRYDYATVAHRDPRVTYWRSAVTGSVHCGPANAGYGVVRFRAGRVADTIIGVAGTAEAATLPKASRFSRAFGRTHRAINQR